VSVALLSAHQTCQSFTRWYGTAQQCSLSRGYLRSKHLATQRIVSASRSLSPPQHLPPQPLCFLIAGVQLFNPIKACRAFLRHGAMTSSQRYLLHAFPQQLQGPGTKHISTALGAEAAAACTWIKTVLTATHAQLEAALTRLRGKFRWAHAGDSRQGLS